eukprot:15343119-Ditylum_brightwellii.AAC.1
MISWVGEVDQTLTQDDLTFEEYMVAGHKDQQWATKHVVAVDEGKYVADVIMQGEAIAISDGSYKIIKVRRHVSLKGADQDTNQFMHLPPPSAS